MRALTPHSSPCNPLSAAPQVRPRLWPQWGSALVALCTAAAVAISPLPAQALVQDGPSNADIAKAKGLYMQAEDFVANGNHAEAIPLYEEAYQLVPGKHGFAFKVGVSAYEVKDCVKAKKYFDHLIEYGSDQEKLAGKIKEAKSILAKIKKSKCDQPKAKAPAKPANQAPAAAPVAIDEDNPFAKPKELTGTEKEAADAVEKSRRRSAQTQRQVEKMKSYGFLSVGAASLVGGGVFLLLARQKGKRLGDLSQPSETLEFFPEGDFACRDPNAPCPYRMTRQMRTFNIVGYALLALGVASAGTGTYFLLQQRKAGKRKQEPNPGTAWRVSPYWAPGGAGATARVKF